MSQNESRISGSINAAGGKPFLRKTITVAVVLLLVGLTLSPRYLVYSDQPRKADIIIQFVGPEQESRLREARYLVQKGYSDYLFIPTYSSLYRVNQDRTGLTLIPFTDMKHVNVSPRTGMHKEGSPEYFQKIKSVCRFPSYFEATHAEIILVKMAMEACGLRSAIFVSSPYHMRRIKIISAKIFGEQASYISYVPTRYENEPIDLRDMDRGNWVFVMREYIKICWFRLYALFI